MPRVRPLRDLVYIIPIEDRSKVGSLYIPEQGQQRIDQGVIKYRGPLVKELRVGDHVLFPAYSGTWMAVEDEGALVVIPEEGVETIIDRNEDAEQLFTKSTIIDFIKIATGNAVARNYLNQAQADKVREDLETQVKDYLYSRALKF